MDNLTHTLIGVLAGEACARSAKSVPEGLPDHSRRNLLVTVCAVGSNLPDIDLLWTMRGFGADPLNYLVHHRGHTHTVLGCMGLLLLLQLASLLWVHWRGLPIAGRDRFMLAVVGALGLGLHLGMDALNSYGIHPFWPFDNRWYYGDAVFIVEPLYWLAVTPLLFLVRTRTAKAVVLCAVLAAAGLTTWLHLAEPWYVVAALGAALAIGIAARRASARVAALVGVAGVAGITALFLWSSHLARGQVERLAAAAFPEATTQDIVLTPSPTDPRCWDLLLLQTGQRQYVARQGRLSLASGAALQRCPMVQLGAGGTAPLAAVRAPAMEEDVAGRLQWSGQFAMPLTQLVELVAGDCRARAAMAFFRAPFAAPAGLGWLLGDLRFDREAGAGFSEIPLPPIGEPVTCRSTAPWLPPRADLLEAAAQG